MKVTLLAHINSRRIVEQLSEQLTQKEILPHMSFTFAIEGISRACSHQIVRHRAASFSQQSQRYIQVKKLSNLVVIPPNLNDAAAVEFEKIIDEVELAYLKLVDLGVPKEDARFVLPNATETSMIMTFDGKSLMHFFGLRLCNRAQWEVKALAEIMLEQVKKVEPELFRSAGPYCVQRTSCPEGRFSCGKITEIRKKYLQENLI